MILVIVLLIGGIAYVLYSWYSGFAAGESLPLVPVEQFAPMGAEVEVDYTPEQRQDVINQRASTDSQQSIAYDLESDSFITTEVPNQELTAQEKLEIIDNRSEAGESTTEVTPENI